MPRRKNSQNFYHKMLEELHDHMLDTIKGWRRGDFSDAVLATRCAHVAFEYVAKKRGFRHKGSNEEMVKFALHNEERVESSCALEPICKHFKRANHV